jgi:hypothetical protein
MADCVTRGVQLDGREELLCLSHVPGNEALRHAREAGQTREPSHEEVQRAIDYFQRSRGRNRSSVAHEIDQMRYPVPTQE